MNVELFKSLLRPYWNTWSVNDLDDAADKIATAYDLSNIGDSAPFFGAKLLKGDKETLKTFLSSGLKLNFSLTAKVPPPLVEPGFTLMATGFCLYWIASNFSPVPPMPPMFAPTTGVQVLFPGVPIGFDKTLKEVFNNTDVEAALSSLANALVAHQLTVAGIYSGLIPSVPSPLPLVLPWVALLSLPSVSVKPPDILNNTDTDKDGIPDNSDDDIDNDGIPNNQDDDKDGDGILNKDEPGKINRRSGGTGGTGGTSGTSGTSGTGGTSGTRGTQGTSGTGSTDPNFDPSTGFDNRPDTEYIEMIGEAENNGDPKPIDRIYIDQDEITQEYFANITKEKIAKNKFKPNLVVDSRQRTNIKGQESYRSNYLQLVVSLREQVLLLNNGDKEYQFYVEAYMNNAGSFSYYDPVAKQFFPTPISIGIPRSKFTFRDTIESDNSIYAGPPFNISSPKQRGLLLMKSPYESIMDDILEYFNDYVTKYFKGRLRKKLQKVDFFLTTEPRQDFNPFGNQVFTKMTNFVKLD